MWRNEYVGAAFLFTPIFLLTLACGTKSILIRSGESLEAHSVPFQISESNVDGNTPGHEDFITIQRKIRTVVHFLNSTDSSSNFKPPLGVPFARNLIYAANQRLTQNRKMNLPEGNQTPVLPIDLSFSWNQQDDISSNIYFHFDDQFCYYRKEGGSGKSRYDREVIQKYGVCTDSILNIFIMPFDPLEVKKGIQDLESTGIALGNSIKLAGLFEEGKPAWQYAGLLNHELGHVLGLSHTWNTNDGCPDTPYHPNCWNRSDEDPCQGTVSNNVMDYNAFQSSFSPCQINRIHSQIVRESSSQRKLIRNDWCKSANLDTLEVHGFRFWKGPMDSKLHVRIKAGGHLQLSGDIRMAEGSSITLEKKGTLSLSDANLYNECDLSWDGIKKERGGKILSAGQNYIRTH